MLKVENINTFYGKVQALFDVSFEINEGEIVSIIGSNGAGKTTLMMSIMHIVPPKSGSITFMGKDITRMKTHDIVTEGIVCVPEGREIFSDISVQDNLNMGAYCRNYSAKEKKEHLEELFTMFPVLKERRKQLAGSLSGGEQQMLAIARGLISDPKLIMFDEPSLGLAPKIVDEVLNHIVSIKEKKRIPIVLVEQNAYMALSISNRCYVLETGRVIMSGDSSVLINNPDVKAAYLGG